MTSKIITCTIKGEHVKVGYLTGKMSKGAPAVTDDITKARCFTEKELTHWLHLARNSRVVHDAEVSDFERAKSDEWKEATRRYKLKTLKDDGTYSFVTHVDLDADGNVTHVSSVEDGRNPKKMTHDFAIKVVEHIRSTGKQQGAPSYAYDYNSEDATPLTELGNIR